MTEESICNIETKVCKTILESLALNRDITKHRLDFAEGTRVEDMLIVNELDKIESAVKSLKKCGCSSFMSNLKMRQDQWSN